MRNSNRVLWLLCVFAAASAVAQTTTFRTGKVYNTSGGELTITPRAQFDYRYTWYSPEIFQYPNGDIGFYTHSGNPSVERTGNSDSMGVASDACGAFAPAGIDDIYNAHRSASGAWTTPAWAQCPKIKGMARHCTYNPQVPGAFNIDASGSPSIVRIANPYSSTGYRYYMLFNNGNSDISVGKVYWAVSDDAENWTTYTGTPPPGYQWKPMIGSEYLDCNGGPDITGYDQGISEADLVFDPTDTAGGINPDGTFYIYFNYSHYRQGVVGHFYDILAFRFGYNPAHPFGFGANPQLFYDGAWIAHSGRLVWDYDQQPPITGDPVLQIAHSVLSWRNATPHGIGRGDLKQNPDTHVWYHVSTWGGKTYMQWNTRLDMDNWTVPIEVNTSSVAALYAPQCRLGDGSTENIAYDPGIWYGTVGGWTGWWMWQPVHVAPSPIPNTLPGCFQGLGMVITKLCMNEQANCDQ